MKSTFESVRSFARPARRTLWAIFFLALVSSRSASALTINFKYDTDAKYMAAGLSAQDIVDMKAANTFAAKILTDRYTDNINVNISVTATPGSNDLGSSQPSTFDNIPSYAALQSALAQRATTADDKTTVGAGGTIRAGADPITATHEYVLPRAQAKALGFRPDDMELDGNFSFGGGQAWTYDPNNRVVAGKFDFIGVAVHEYTELMGRTSLMGFDFGNGEPPAYLLFDLFHFTGPGARGLNNGPNRFFSIDNGTTLLKAFEDAIANPGNDFQDWAGNNMDSFDASGPPGELAAVTPIDFRVMDVIGFKEKATGTTPTLLANISTRLPVQTGDNVLIGGFIITGTQPKKVIVNGKGPSLAQFFPGTLADPVLELRDGSNSLLESNDNWIDSQNKQAIINSKLAPSNNAESSILRSLPASPAGLRYTAILRGVNNGTGIGVVEAFDLDTTANSRLANISTRGFVQGGDNVMIAGTIVLGPSAQKVVIRAIGPSLTGFGVPDALQDPTLELHDGNGATLEANDDWVDSPNKQAIIDSGLAPANDSESAIIRTLPGSTTGVGYTAIVRGANNSVGVALVEIYGIASSTPANPAMFVANGGNNSITKANVDGTGGAVLPITAGLLAAPQGVAINATAGKLYAGNEGGDTVTMANLDGSGGVNLTLGGLLKGPYGVALDVAAGKMYVANGGGFPNPTPRVVRANLDGSSPVDLGSFNNLFGTNGQSNFPQGMALDVTNGKMYIALQQGVKVVQANLDGSGATGLQPLTTLIGTETPLDIAVDVAGNRIYVVTFEGNIYAAGLDGANAANLGNLGGKLKDPRGIGLDLVTQKMYVGNSGNNTVTRADLPNGANPVVLSVATLNMPAVVAINHP